jgi:hypothetical protein
MIDPILVLALAIHTTKGVYVTLNVPLLAV